MAQYFEGGKMKLKFYSLIVALIISAFTNSAYADSAISDEILAKLDSWGINRPSNELYLKYNTVFDNPLYYDQLTGAVIWPKNDGFGETPYTVTLNSGTFIDRFGSDYGFYVCPAGIDYTMRSCAPGTEDRAYSVFVLKKPVDVQAGIIASWFDEEGGGYQYFLPSSVMSLINDGSLRRVEQWEFASNDHAQPAVIVQQHSTTSRILADHLQAPPNSDIWINFDRRFGHLDYSGKYHSSTVYGGFDKVFGKNRHGLFITYGATNFSSNTANADIDDTRIGIYTSRVDGTNSIFAYLSYGWQKNKLRRHVDEIYLNSAADYRTQLFETGGEYKHDLTPEESYHISPFIGVTASYLKQSAYNEKITDIFRQRVDSDNNFYAAIKPGIEFRREFDNGSYALRLGCEYAFTGTRTDINFNYANYDRSVYKMTSKTDKFHWALGLNGKFNLAQNLQLAAETFFRKGAHDREFSAAIQLQHNF